MDEGLTESTSGAGGSSTQVSSASSGNEWWADWVDDVLCEVQTSRADNEKGTANGQFVDLNAERDEVWDEV